MGPPELSKASLSVGVPGVGSSLWRPGENGRGSITQVGNSDPGVPCLQTAHLGRYPSAAYSPICPRGCQPEWATAAHCVSDLQLRTFLGLALEQACSPERNVAALKQGGVGIKCNLRVHRWPLLSSYPEILRRRFE